MSRNFAKISQEKLIEKVQELQELTLHSLRDKLGKDLKVSFDGENFESNSGSFGPEGLMGLVTLGNGFTFWGMCAGGDWESPVFFILYFDGKKIRAYIPTEGNPWNTITKTAYGNDSKADWEDARKRYPEFANSPDLKNIDDFDGTDLNDFDSGKILNDILERIKPK